MTSKPRIGIIIGTTRPARFADTPANWLLQLALKRNDAAFELVDLRDYRMPFFEEDRSPLFSPSQDETAKRWAAKMASLDGYVFITAEYNHSISGVLKNALDFLGTEVRRKPATFVGYGSMGGARAVEHLRHILAEMQVASLKFTTHIGATELIAMLREGKTMADFPYFDEVAVRMLDDIVWWSRALQVAREEARAEAA